jgi:hypothetical protein
MTNGKVVLRPVYLPPVWCRDNADGTYSWPMVNGCWSVIRKPSDVPYAYRHPPVRVEMSKDATP